MPSITFVISAIASKLRTAFTNPGSRLFSLAGSGSLGPVPGS